MIEVEELTEHCLGDDLINDNLTREEQMWKGKAILNELKYACMLEEDYHYYRRY